MSCVGAKFMKLAPGTVPVLPPWTTPPFDSPANLFQAAPQTPKVWDGRPIGLTEDLPFLPIAWLPENAGMPVFGLPPESYQPTGYLWKRSNLQTLRTPGVILVFNSSLGPLIGADATLAPQLTAAGINVLKVVTGVIASLAAPCLPIVNGTTVIDGGDPAFGTNIAGIYEPDKWTGGDILEISEFQITSEDSPYSTHHSGGSEFALSNLLASDLAQLTAAKDFANRYRKVWLPIADPGFSAFGLATMLAAAAAANAIVPTVMYPSVSSAGLPDTLYPAIASEIRSFFGLT